MEMPAILDPEVNYWIKVLYVFIILISPILVYKAIKAILIGSLSSDKNITNTKLTTEQIKTGIIRKLPVEEGFFTKDALTVCSPADTKVIRLLYKNGDHIEKGKPVCIVEMLKCETDLNMYTTGTIQYLVQEGQDIEKETPLFTITPDETEYEVI